MVRVLDLEPFDFREEGRILRYEIATGDISDYYLRAGKDSIWRSF